MYIFLKKLKFCITNYAKLQMQYLLPHNSPRPEKDVPHAQRVL